jgi:ribonuclease HI
MENRHWLHPSKHITIIEGQERTTHSLQVYTDGSKNEDGPGSEIAVFDGAKLITTQKSRLNACCSNNQAEQFPILNVLEYIQNRQDVGKTITLYTDSRITLQSLQNGKCHTHLIDQIRNKEIDMEQQEWKVELSWIKAQVGHRGNELADCLAKEESTSKNIEECYNRAPKSTV